MGSWKPCLLPPVALILWRSFCSFSSFPVPDPGFPPGGGKVGVWLPPLCRMDPERCCPGIPPPEVWEGGLVWGSGGAGVPQPCPSLLAWACLPPSTPEASWGVARGVRAWPLREGIRNSEIKCISLGNASHSEDQIKCIKVQGGKKLFRTDRGKTSPKGREAERRRENKRVVQSSSSAAELLF